VAIFREVKYKEIHTKNTLKYKIKSVIISVAMHKFKIIVIEKWYKILE
jgi:hypothetical protein